MNFMKLLLLLKLCLPTTKGFTEQFGSWFAFNGYWYQHFNIKTSWSDALLFCDQLDAAIVTFHSNVHFDIVRKSEHFNASSFWVGLEKRSESWYWIDSELKVEPGNLVRNSKYVFYDPKQSSYNGASNDGKHTIVCQKQAGVLGKRNCDTSNGWLINDSGCFKKFKLALTWLMSRKFCQAYGGELVEINSQCRNDFLISLLSNDEIWIGLYRPYYQWHKLTWISGSDVIYNNVRLNLERKRLHGTNYFYFMNTTGKWFESVHQFGIQPEKKMFICQKMFHAKSYFVHKTAVTWHEAEKKCTNNGQILAEILNQNDQEEVNRISGHAFYGWIGLSDLKTERRFFWNSKHDYLYTNLKNVQSKGCVITYSNTSVWKSMDCQSRYYYICEVKTPDQPEVISPCKSDEIYFDENCYYKMPKKNTWIQSQKLCEERNMNLASILSHRERDFATRHQFIYLWLGCKYYRPTDRFMWIDGHKMEYTAWKSTKQTAGCVLRTFKWVTARCSDKNEALCKGSALAEVPSPCNNFNQYRNNCYFISQELVNETSAQTICNSVNMQLASVMSYDEQVFIETKLHEGKSYWLGAKLLYSKTFVWTDGGGSLDVVWSSSESNNKNKNNACVKIQTSGIFSDDCNLLAYPICKESTTVKAITYCHDGWTKFHGFCYKNHIQDLWNAAKLNCEDEEARISSILSTEEENFISLFTNGSNIWLGAIFKDNQWKWVDGQPFDYSSFSDVNMNNTKGCLEKTVSGWHQTPCDAVPKRYVCKTAEKIIDNQCDGGFHWNGRCYRIHSYTRNWDDAKKECESKNSTLASVLSPDENEIITKFFNIDDYYWIGANNAQSNNTYYWIDGSGLVTWSNWHPSQHGSSISNKRCLAVQGSDGQWRAYSCEYTAHFVCSWSPGTGLNQSVISEQTHGSWKWYGGIEERNLIHFNISLTWFQAAQLCEDVGGYLLKTQEKDRIDKSFFLEYTGHWVGLKYVNSTISWSDGSVDKDVNWALKPNSSGGCGVHTKCGIQLSDCSAKRDFICYRDNNRSVNLARWKNVSGAFMYISSIETDFKNAKRICTAADAILTEIINDCIYSDLLVHTEPMFIGLEQRHYPQGDHKNLEYQLVTFNDRDYDCTILHANGSLEKVLCESKYRFSCLKHPERYKPSTCGGCPWKPFNGACYINIASEITWQESSMICRAYDGHLPILDHKDKILFLTKLSFSQRFWIGNTSSLSMQCPLVNGNYKQSTNCTEKASFICERSIDSSQRTNATCNSPWIYNDNSCYLFSNIKATQRGAMSICQGFRGSLTSIRNQKESIFLKKMVDLKSSSFYIGLISNAMKKIIRWTDGTPYNFTEVQKEPNSDDKACVLMESSGKWVQEHCQNLHFFICNRRDVAPVGPSSSVSPTASATPSIKNYRWKEWSSWQPCDVFCGRGNQTRTRQCKFMNPSDCSGNSKEQRQCEGIGDCSSYKVTKAGSSCSSFCEEDGKVCDILMQTGGTVELFVALGFVCNNNQSQKNWKVEYAPYYDIETSTCVGYDNMPPKLNCSAIPPTPKSIRLCKCVEKGDFQMLGWSPWSSCSGTCEGHRLRTRSCALNAGMDETCSGATVQSETCNAQLCPVHGGFTMWGNWSDCSTTCDSGLQRRFRNCSNPIPMNGGLKCVGPTSEEKTCGARHCPIDGGWTQWSVVSACTKPCNNGGLIQRRYCINPKPLYGGRECQGSPNVTKPCNNFPCKEVDLDVQCKFQLPFLPGYKYSTSLEWQQFQNNLFTQLEDSIGQTVSAVKLLQLKNGSVEAKFRVTFTKLDSQQLINLQDSMQQDFAVGKLPIATNSKIVFKPYLVPSAPPSNVTVVPNSPTTFNVSWSEVKQGFSNGKITGYLIMYRERLLMSDPYMVFASYGYWEVVTGLHAGTRYLVRVLAYNQNGNGVASDVVEVSTLEMLPSSPPATLKTQVINDSAIFIEWTGLHQRDINGVLLGYRIYYTQRRSVVNNNMVVPFDSLYATITGLKPSITYIISVCAFNGAGEGPQQTATETTKYAAPTSPPNSLNVTHRTHDSLALSWMTQSKDLDGFLLQYSIIQQDSQDVVGPYVYERRFSAAMTSHIVIDLESNTKYMFQLAGYNHHGNGPSISLVAETCKCPKLVHSNYYLKSPYVYRPSVRSTGQLSGIFPGIVKDMIKQACGSCSGLYSETLVDFSTNGKYGFAGKQNLDRVVEDIDNFTEISFPMSTNPVKEKTIKAEFIPIISYPGAVFIIKEETLGERIESMIIEILKVWPIFLIDMAFIMISGAIVWALEKWANRERDFSALGSEGVKQGFYWAYVTQTTVGYGDFVPKSVRARSFAIIWMILSVVVASLLTGALTTAFTSVEVKEINSIYGVKVAALHNSIEERIAILRNGNLDRNKRFTSIQQLVDALMSDEVSGILLDAYSAGRERQYLKSLPLRPIFSINYPRTFGVVVTSNLANVKNELDAYIITNQAFIVDTVERYTQKMMPKGPKKSLSLFDSKSMYMQRSIVALCVGWLVFAIFGYVMSIVKSRLMKKAVILPEENVNSLKHDLDELCKICSEFPKEYLQRTHQMYDRFMGERIRLFFDKGACSLRLLDDEMKEQYNKRLRRKKRLRTFSAVEPMLPVPFDGDHFKFTNLLKPEKNFPTKGRKQRKQSSGNSVFALNM